jgi:hypothetical protein
VIGEKCNKSDPACLTFCNEVNYERTEISDSIVGPRLGGLQLISQA